MKLAQLNIATAKYLLDSPQLKQFVDNLDVVNKTAEGCADFMRRKYDWFQRVAEDTYVLWWVDNGYIPTLDEAKLRLEYLPSKPTLPVPILRHLRLRANNVSE